MAQDTKMEGTVSPYPPCLRTVFVLGYSFFIVHCPSVSNVHACIPFYFICVPCGDGNPFQRQPGLVQSEVEVVGFVGLGSEVFAGTHSQIVGVGVAAGGDFYELGAIGECLTRQHDGAVGGGTCNAVGVGGDGGGRCSCSVGGSGIISLCYFAVFQIPRAAEGEACGAEQFYLVDGGQGGVAGSCGEGDGDLAHAVLHADACVVRCHGGAFAPQQVGGFVVGGSGAAVVLVGLDADVGHGVGVGGGVGIGIVGVEGVLVGDVLPVEGFVGEAAVYPWGVLGVEGGGDGGFTVGTRFVGDVEAQCVVIIELGGADGGAADGDIGAGGGERELHVDGLGDVHCLV